MNACRCIKMMFEKILTDSQSEEGCRGGTFLWSCFFFFLQKESYNSEMPLTKSSILWFDYNVAVGKYAEVLQALWRNFKSVVFLTMSLQLCPSLCTCSMAVNRCCWPGQWSEQRTEPDSLQSCHPSADSEETASSIHAYGTGQNHYPENTEHGSSHGLRYLQTRSVCGANKQAHSEACHSREREKPLWGLQVGYLTAGWRKCEGV